MFPDTVHPKPYIDPSRGCLSEKVLQGWTHAQIKNVTLHPSSPQGNVYFKIHLGSLVWNSTSVADPSCVYLVPVTTTPEPWELSWKELWSPTAVGIQQGPSNSHCPSPLQT